MVNLGYVGRETSNEQRQNIFVSIAARSDLLSPEEYTSSWFETAELTYQPKCKQSNLGFYHLK